MFFGTREVTYSDPQLAARLFEPPSEVRGHHIALNQPTVCPHATHEHPQIKRNEVSHVIPS